MLRKIRTVVVVGGTSLLVGLLGASPALAGTVTASSGISVPNVTMTAPPGANEFEKVLGYGLWLGAAACFTGVILYVIKAVTAHGFGRNAVEHTGALGMALAGALILGVAGSALNGLM